jgi:hypothetical protein
MKRKHETNTLPSNSLGRRRHLAMVKLQTPRSQRKVKKKVEIFRPPTETVVGGDYFHGDDAVTEEEE